MTNFNIARECRERAEPFCVCPRPEEAKKYLIGGHERDCLAPQVYAALLKMAEDTASECARIAEALLEHEPKLEREVRAAIERLVGGGKDANTTA